MAHTPGPWRVHSEVPNRIILNGSACYEVVDLVRMEQYHNYADMRLIAAAPELLAALRDAADAIDLAQAQVDSENDRYTLCKRLVAVKRVIAKAEGRHHADA